MASQVFWLLCSCHIQLSCSRTQTLSNFRVSFCKNEEAVGTQSRDTQTSAPTQWAFTARIRGVSISNSVVTRKKNTFSECLILRQVFKECKHNDKGRHFTVGNSFLWPVNWRSIMHESPSQWEEKQFNSLLCCLRLNRGRDLKQWWIHMNAFLTKGALSPAKKGKGHRAALTPLSVKVRKQATFLSQVTLIERYSTDVV